MTKKILCNILVLFLLIFSVVYAAKVEILHYDGGDHKYTGPEVTLELNGKVFEVTEGLMQPIILENRTLVPVREVFETLGGKVSWEAAEKRVDIELGKKTISLWIDKTEAMVDGKKMEIDVPAKIINSKTMVPARFISEQGELLVEWVDESKTVKIQNPMALVTKVEYTKINDINCIVVTAENAISGYKYFMLEEPNRLILDIENSKFQLDTSTQTVEDDLISTIRFGMQENQVNRVVLDLKKDTDYVVVPSIDKTKLYFAMASEFSILGETEVDPSQKEENGSSFESGESTENSGDVNNSNVEVPDNSGDTTPGAEEPTHSGDSNPEIDEPTYSGDNNPGVEEPIHSGDGNNGNEESDSVREPSNGEENTEEEGQKIILPDVYVTSVKYSTLSKRVKIAYDGSMEYRDSFLANPNRIVIDIKNAELKAEGPKEISPKGSVITGIRFSQYEENSVRVVLDLSDKVDYKVYKRASELQVEVNQPTYKNISYKLNTANAQITLSNVDIDDLTATKSTSSDKYTIKYSSKNFDSGEGEFAPEDELVEKVEISSTKIVIYDTGNMVYTMRQSGSNVVVTIKKEEKTETTDRKVILIDAGHGGSDPGACNGSAQEKVYNLNIATYLYLLLCERDDVEVYMSREDDTYLNREDRVAIATTLNPDLIVSVHNNSLENKAYSGTMVLYYNNETESQYGDITSKECAQIVLEKLVDALGTVNRGAVNREDLHILSKTPCPSILCEVSFISNDAELERLKTKTFQIDAAQAIYDGVAEILEIM